MPTTSHASALHAGPRYPFLHGWQTAGAARHGRATRPQGQRWWQQVTARGCTRNLLHHPGTARRLPRAPHVALGTLPSRSRPHSCPRLGVRVLRSGQQHPPARAATVQHTSCPTPCAASSARQQRAVPPPARSRRRRRHLHPFGTPTVPVRSGIPARGQPQSAASGPATRAPGGAPSRVMRTPPPCARPPTEHGEAGEGFRKHCGVGAKSRRSFFFYHEFF